MGISGLVDSTAHRCSGVLLVLLLGACGGGGSSPPPAVPLNDANALSDALLNKITVGDCG